MGEVVGTFEVATAVLGAHWVTPELATHSRGTFEDSEEDASMRWAV